MQQFLGTCTITCTYLVNIYEVECWVQIPFSVCILEKRKQEVPIEIKVLNYTLH